MIPLDPKPDFLSRLWFLLSPGHTHMLMFWLFGSIIGFSGDLAFFFQISPLFSSQRSTVILLSSDRCLIHTLWLWSVVRKLALSPFSTNAENMFFLWYMNLRLQDFWSGSFTALLGNGWKNWKWDLGKEGIGTFLWFHERPNLEYFLWSYLESMAIIIDCLDKTFL